LFLFVLGYWYTGLMSLLQGRFDSLAKERAEERSPNRFRWGVEQTGPALLLFAGFVFRTRHRD